MCYKNLYRYLYYRLATPKKLSGVTQQLLRWEEEFHGNDRVEALACWRLHLGSSDVLRAIVRSVQEPGLVGRFYDLWVPIKDAGRKQIRGFIRSKAPQSTFSSFHALYSLWNTAMYLVKPFVGAAFLYFDIFKDIVFTHLIYISIMALTKGELNPKEYPFEFSLMVGLGAMFIINLVIWTVISVYYSQVGETLLT